MATNFLWYAGTVASSYNGLNATAFTVLSSDMSSGIASSGTTISGANGVSGVFTSSYAAQAIWGWTVLTWGTSATTGPAAGGNVAGWFLQSYDGGTIYETSAHTASVPMRRPPDFIIPHSTESISAGDVYFSAGIVRLPPLPYKVFLQNNLGITAPSSSTGYSSLKIAPVAMQY